MQASLAHPGAVTHRQYNTPGVPPGECHGLHGLGVPRRGEATSWQRDECGHQHRHPCHPDLHAHVADSGSQLSPEPL
ncbi:MAG: hypothetical protein ACK55I_05665 [bacterium]